MVQGIRHPARTATFFSTPLQKGAAENMLATTVAVLHTVTVTNNQTVILVPTNNVMGELSFNYPTPPHPSLSLSLSLSFTLLYILVDLYEYRVAFSGCKSTSVLLLYAELLV